MFSFWCTRFGKLGSLNKLFGFCLEGKFQGTIKPLKALQITILPKRRWCYLCYLKHKNSTIVASSWEYRKAIVRPPPPHSAGGGGGVGRVEPPTKFSNRGKGAWQDLNFWREVAGKEGVTFSGGLQFSQKKSF